MSYPETEWTLDQLASAVSSVDNDYGATLKRVDRDESEIYDGSGTVDMTEPRRTMSGELQRAAFVGVTRSDRDTTPVGTEYDHEVSTTVGVRVVGLHYHQRGEIDPDGTDGVPFDELLRRVRGAITDQRRFPDAGGTSTEYTHLTLANEADGSEDYSDFYRADLDVMFDGFQDL